VVAVSAWIPVGERMPEQCQSVLVTDGEEIITAVWEFGCFDYDRGHWHCDQATHWMPLPDLPGAPR
jgi:hypothetical protein